MRNPYDKDALMRRCSQCDEYAKVAAPLRECRECSTNGQILRAGWLVVILLMGTTAMMMLSRCATPRSSALLGLDYSSQPARVAIRWDCNGQAFTTQGTGVCEQRGPSLAKVSVKIPPLEGRVIYSNGQLKQTEDFNWYPKEGFWIWKKKPIKDTWAELNLGEINASFGDWPVALDVAAVHDKVGAIVTRGVLYHRICNDQDVPCSKLVVKFECAGYEKATAAGQIGKCERLSGSPQAFRIQLRGPGYEARSGAKVYLRALRLGLNQALSPSDADLAQGELKVEAPEVPNGPTLLGLRLVWLEEGIRRAVETRILVVGFSPEWTGLDQPHFVANDGGVDFVKPVLADVMEVNLYEGREIRKKSFGTDRTIGFPRPQGAQVACAFAWQRDSSDQSVLCLNTNLEEVSLP